ncbi:MAG TPA: zinc dependent phospholipase C family protein [Geobacteraceae bacterium]|nr:zinc dependent phospholipase C family protein [Geobacteraceae bacterium]
MGKEISHILMADQTARSLADPGRDPLASTLCDFSPAFHFGSIAADTFFYGIKVPFLEKKHDCCGDMIHGFDGNDTSLPILRMLRDLKNSRDDRLFRVKLAFVCGFLTHVALDAVCHPCIYYFSGNYHHENIGERIRAVTRHRLMESWLDLFVLRKASLSIDSFPFMDTIRGNPRLNLALLRFFFNAFEQTANIDGYLWKYLRRGYSVQMLLNSMFPNAFWGKMVGAMNRALKGKLNTFMALFYPWEYREIPPEVFNYEYYRHPVTGEEFPGDFNELWDNALLRSLEFLEAVRGYIYGDGNPDRLGGVIKGYSLSMGLVGVPVSSAGYFDIMPLHRIWAY